MSLAQNVGRTLAFLLLPLDRFAYGLGRLVMYARSQRMFPHKGTLLDYSTRIKYPERIDMGRDVWIGPEVSIGAAGGIRFGNRVRISYGAFIETGSLDFSGEPPYSHITRPIDIAEGVWIGANATVLGGVKIGRQAIVAAGAVVTKDVAADEIVAGVPARPVGRRGEGEQRSTP